MKYIGWKTKEVPFMDSRTGREIRKEINLYIFDNPELVRYKSGFIGVRPRNFNDYEHWHMKGVLEKIEPVKLSGIGIHKDCFSRLNTRTNLIKLAERIGIRKEDIQKILSDS